MKNILSVSSTLHKIKSKAYRKLAKKQQIKIKDANRRTIQKDFEAYDILSDTRNEQNMINLISSSNKVVEVSGFHSDPFDMFNSFFGGGGGNFDSFFTSDNEKEEDTHKVLI